MAVTVKNDVGSLYCIRYAGVLPNKTLEQQPAVDLTKFHVIFVLFLHVMTVDLRIGHMYLTHSYLLQDEDPQYVCLAILC